MDDALLIEPFGGLAGDMFLAALLDLRDPRFALADLRALAEALVPGESELELSPTERGSIAASLLEVRTPESADAPHRHLAECLERVRAAPLGARGRAFAEAVFRRIAEAEGRVHGVDPEEVHFHEVGAVDALIDVCGAALALERLGVRRVLATPPLVGSGSVLCAHGEFPVPAPGTAEILRGLPYRLGGEGERLTPTGAAILAVGADDPDYRGTFAASRTGYGAGRRDPAGPPNLVRVQLGTCSAAPAEAGAPAADAGVALSRGEVLELAFNVDDMTGEAVGYLVGRLRAAGALEVWTQAVQMKKDRPGVLVSALCRPADQGALERAAFLHSSTLGLRWSRRERAECERAVLEVEVAGGRVRVKQRARSPSSAPGPFDLKPEHDDLVALAERTGLAPAELARRALEEAQRRLGP
jgi:uncharacterized protein (TIGR00299 family) protein